MRIYLLLTFFLLQSCSTIRFKSSGAIPVSMGHHEDATAFFTVRGERDFYLWGLLSMNEEVLLDQELSDLGARKAYILKFGLDHELAWKTWLFTFISFGMYRPEYYVIYAKGMKTNE